MNYILFGELDPMIKTRLKKILKERLGEVNDFNVTKYNFLEDNIEDILFEISSLPLGIERKAVVIDNAIFLSETGQKENLARFKEATPLNDENIDVIFIVHKDSIDEKNDLYKMIKEHGQVLNFMSIDKKEWPLFIKKYFTDRKYEIDSVAASELADRIDGDLTRFVNEANKLMLYTNHITLNDVLLFVAKPIEDDVFQLSNALFRRDNATALEIYRGLKLLGSKATDSLIPMLASQFRFINQVRYLNKKQYDNTEIMNILKLKSPYRVKIALDNARRLPYGSIAQALNDLYNLDYQIKSGKIDKNYGFELFLINFPN